MWALLYYLMGSGCQPAARTLNVMVESGFACGWGPEGGWRAPSSEIGVQGLLLIIVALGWPRGICH